MKNATERQGQSPEENEFDNALEEVLREGARKMLQSAIENEAYTVKYIDIITNRFIPLPWKCHILDFKEL